MAESGLQKPHSGLENRSTRKGTQGSNPCLSAFDSRSKRSVYPRNPEFSRGFFAFMAPAFACHVLHSAVQNHAARCKFQRAVRHLFRRTDRHRYRHLGTIDGTLVGQRRVIPALIAIHQYPIGPGQIARFWRRPVYRFISKAHLQLGQRIGLLIGSSTGLHSRNA